MYVPKLEVPPSARHKTVAGLANAFYRAQKDVSLAGIDDNALPYFARKYLRKFREVTDGEVRGAILDGDPWFFIGWRARLAQVDAAMIEANFQIPDRWSLVRAQHMLDLLQMVASKRLVALGGTAITTAADNGETQDPTGTNR